MKMKDEENSPKTLNNKKPRICLNSCKPSNNKMT